MRTPSIGSTRPIANLHTDDVHQDVQQAKTFSSKKTAVDKGSKQGRQAPDPGNRHGADHLLSRAATKLMPSNRVSQPTPEINFHGSQLSLSNSFVTRIDHWLHNKPMHGHEPALQSPVSRMPSGSPWSSSGSSNHSTNHAGARGLPPNGASSSGYSYESASVNPREHQFYTQEPSFHPTPFSSIHQPSVAGSSQHSRNSVPESDHPQTGFSMQGYSVSQGSTSSLSMGSGQRVPVMEQPQNGQGSGFLYTTLLRRGEAPLIPQRQGPDTPPPVPPRMPFSLVGGNPTPGALPQQGSPDWIPPVPPRALVQAGQPMLDRPMMNGPTSMTVFQVPGYTPLTANPQAGHQQEVHVPFDTPLSYHVDPLHGLAIFGGVGPRPPGTRPLGVQPMTVAAHPAPGQQPNQGVFVAANGVNGVASSESMASPSPSMTTIRL